VLALPLLVHATVPVGSRSSVNEANTTAAVPQLPLRARLDKETIRAAVKDLPAEPAPDARRFGAAAPGPTAGEHFAQGFANARLPDCLHADGLKNQPTFFLNGVLALPFIAVAKLRGVCR